MILNDAHLIKGAAANHNYCKKNTEFINQDHNNNLPNSCVEEISR